MYYGNFDGKEMMVVLILFSSKTGNVKRFMNKLLREYPEKQLEAVDLNTIDGIDKPYILVTYTTKMGQVPEEVSNFLSKNEHRELLLGVASSGNRNWGRLFGRAADTISDICSTKEHRVPMIHKFELSGTTKDRQTFMERVELL